MDNTIAIQLQKIKQKVLLLLVENSTLQKQNTALQENLQKQIASNTALTSEVQQLQTQLKALQLLQSNLPDEEKTALSKSIDKHIATLQKTITILSE
jgi:regulator of replication initiation timing